MAARPYAPSATSRHGDTCGGGIQRVDGFHRSSRPRWHVSGAQHAAVVDAAFLSRGTEENGAVSHDAAAELPYWPAVRGEQKSPGKNLGTHNQQVESWTKGQDLPHRA